MNEIFYEIHSNLPRQGPGDVMVTLDCFRKVTRLDNSLKVLDIGCGTGFQTLFLSINSNFDITAVDNHQPFVDELQEKANGLGLGNKLKVMNKDMASLDFIDESYDILLSEGSAYIIGLEKALLGWKRLLKKSGYQIFSDLCWIKEPPKGDLTEFWAKEYPSMMYIDDMKKLISNCGYSLVYEQSLPSNAWVNNYYYPVAINVIKVREKYKSNPEAQEIVEWVQKEIDIFYKYHQYFTYCFFVCRLNG